MDNEKIVQFDVEKEILSKEQPDISDMRSMNKKNDEIIEKHKLSGNALFTTSVFSTMKGEKKIPNGSSGGKDSYLSDTNEFLFKRNR